MSYNKTTWNTGDTITAEKLNNMEQGIDSNSNVFYIEQIYDETSDTYTYVSNVVFDAEVKYSNMFYKADFSNYIFPLYFNGTDLISLSVNPAAEPSISCMEFTLDGNDETGLKYITYIYYAELAFRSDDDDPV